MPFTQEQLEKAGYNVPAAPPDDWRGYDASHPVPAYFDFDWFSSRHPDLYHAFALSTDALIGQLHQMVDLTGGDVLDVGAGTGRSAMGLARHALRVIALDAFESVVAFGARTIRQAGIPNIHYTRGHRDHLPFPASSFDACVSSWAELNWSEAFRVLKPGGSLIFMGAAPGALCGELSALLQHQFPHLITEVAPPGQFDPACPVEDTFLDQLVWNGLPIHPPGLRRDFTCQSDYGDYQETAAIFGRLYGPTARQYFLDRQQSRIAWRLRIEIFRVRK